MLVIVDVILVGCFVQVVDYYVWYVEVYFMLMGGYGNSFQNWVIQKIRIGYVLVYNSCGNGLVMCVGLVGWVFDMKNDIMNVVKVLVEGIYNYLEGIKGVQVIVICIFLVCKGVLMDEIQLCMEQDFGYCFLFIIVEL